MPSISSLNRAGWCDVARLCATRRASSRAAPDRQLHELTHEHGQHEDDQASRTAFDSGEAKPPGAIATRFAGRDAESGDCGQGLG
jgi:hypothetical protein